uniref:endolytic transglycosylase MltG n=1 Tax=Nocardiopsis sp. CNT312 TaxID=1137268 RepID=UPI00049029D7
RARRARPEEEAGPVDAPEEPPRRARRARPEEEPDQRAEEPPGRRGGRRKRARRSPDEEGGFLSDVPEDSGIFDSASFPGVNRSADTGAFSVVDPDRAPRGGGRRRDRSPKDEREAPPEPEAPSGRGGRRRRGPVAEEPPERGGLSSDTGSLPLPGYSAAPAPEPEPDPEEGYDDYEDAYASAPAEEEPPRRRGGGRRRRSVPDEAPSGRRGGRRRRGRREPEPEEFEEGYDDYEEPALDDIADAYYGSRSKRKQLKQAQRAKRSGGGRGGQRKGGGMRILLVLALIVVIGGGGYLAVGYLFPEDFEGGGTGEVVFTVEEGQSGSSVAEALVDAGVVASERAFLNALDAADGGVVPGTYSLAQSMSGESAVAILLDPTSQLGGRITIPEGLRAEDMFVRLAEQTALSEEDFEAAYADTDALGLPEYATAGPEGYLFPETYQFAAGTSAHQILRTMVNQFNQVAADVDIEGRAGGLGYTANEIVTIASIVQAESGREEDMPNISAVVHNRLEADWPLQMDSTCFYQLGTHGLALTPEQKTECENNPGDYGTYGQTGLPAGPFVAPGKSAIEAALAPADVTYMFFALINPETGETGFSTTIDEHDAMVAENRDNW